MFDLELTKTGDLIFIENERKSTTLEVSFVLSNSNALRVSFICENSNEISGSENSLSIMFDMDNATMEHSCKTIHEDKAIIQLIKNKLDTTIGELELRKEFGSQLVSIKHKPLHSRHYLLLTEEMVMNALVGILENPNVKVRPIVIKNNSYEQKLEINIFDDGFLIFKHSI